MVLFHALAAYGVCRASSATSFVILGFFKNKTYEGVQKKWVEKRLFCARKRLSNLFY